MLRGKMFLILHEKLGVVFLRTGIPCSTVVSLLLVEFRITLLHQVKKSMSPFMMSDSVVPVCVCVAPAIEK